MTTEVAPIGISGIELGVLNIADVALALGADLETAETIEVLVVSATDMPFAGIVRLDWKPSGPGWHRALACPHCGEPRFKLYVFDGGRLGCARCARRHPRRVAERTCATWSRGGRDEDQLLRLVAGRSRPTEVAIEQGQRLARELIRGDEDRAAAALQFGEAAVTAVEASS